jgi:HEAT repeat protein
MVRSRIHLPRAVLVCVVVLLQSLTAVAQTDPVSVAIEGLQTESATSRLNSVRELSRLGEPRAVEPLIKVLNDLDPKVRRAAAEALGWLKDIRATEPIIKLLRDTDPSVSCGAAQALGLIGDVRAVEPLIDVFRGKNFSLKCAAAESLGKLKDPRAIEPLSVLLWNGEGELQDKAQYALMEMGPVVVEPLCRILLEPNDARRFFVVDVLTKLHDVRAVGPLVSVLGIGENGIGAKASEALIGIGPPAVDALLVAITSQDPSVRRFAASALGGIKDARAIASLLAALMDENLNVRRQALEAVARFQDDRVLDALLFALSDPGLRIDAGLLLGARKDVRALPYLMEALRGNESDRAAAANRLLILIGTPAVEELITLLRDRNPEYPEREAKRELERSKAQLMECGSGPPPPILDPRRLAAIALGEIGDKRAIGPLTEALADQSLDLRADAERAVAKLGQPPTQGKVRTGSSSDRLRVALALR